MGKDCRLGIVREGQVGLGPAPHETGQLEIQGLVNSLKYGASTWKPVCEIPSHSYALCPLAGAQDDRLHHRTTVLPHVNPPPNPTMSTTAPGPMRPERTHSSSVIGIEADDVFP